MSGEMMSAVIKMPFELAMGNVLSRAQYYQHANMLLEERESLQVDRDCQCEMKVTARDQRDNMTAIAGSVRDEWRKDQAEIVRLKTENTDLRRDAERYRLLRKSTAKDGEHANGICIDLWESGCGFELSPDEADAAIDSALSKGDRP